MKKNVLALSIAAMAAGFAGSAFAVTDYVAPAGKAAALIPASGTTPASPAVAAGAALQLSTTGTCHSLVVPYFSAQNGNKTLLSLTNTDSYFGKAVKIRFRGAANSDDVYDFQVFLSPGDVWTADIHQGADGYAALTTSDNSCTKPTSVNQSFKDSRFKAAGWTDAVNQSNTREGYIEIFNMADIVPIAGKNGVYESIKHSAAGVPLCTNVPANAALAIAAGTAWTDIDKVGNNTAALNAAGLIEPSTGLMANWTIINVPNATAWSGAATAIEAVTAAVPPVPGTGAVVYFPQVNATVGGALTGAVAANFTADPLLSAGLVSGQAQFDLPDMSTTYVGAAGPTPASVAAQASVLTAALATTSINNEFWTLDAISGATDWVFSMPTRRYSAAVDYSNLVGGVVTPIIRYTDLGAAGAAGDYFNATNMVLNSANIACVSGITNTFWNREEGTAIVAAGDTSSSPGDAAPAPLAMCGETSVLAFNDSASTGADAAPTKVLGAQTTVRNYNLAIGGTKVQEGWMRLNTSGLANVGLPIIGSAFMSAFNPEVSAGTAGNFSMTFPHRTTRP